MIDHVSIPVRDLAAAAAFYDRVLAPLGYRRLAERPKTIGYGKKYPEFWLNARPEMAVPDDSGHHVCLRCRDEATVSQFHQLALDLGGRSGGAPGSRQGEMTTYFGAFIVDADGNRIEAVSFSAPGAGQ